MASYVLKSHAHYTFGRCAVGSLTGANHVKRSEASFPPLAWNKDLSQFELDKPCHAVRKFLEASTKSDDDDIINLPLEIPYRRQEVASYNAMLCTNVKLENNTQIKYKLLSLV